MISALQWGRSILPVDPRACIRRSFFLSFLFSFILQGDGYVPLPARILEKPSVDMAGASGAIGSWIVDLAAIIVDGPETQSVDDRRGFDRAVGLGSSKQW